MATILVVDDEQEISSAIRSILEDEGHQLDVCDDGKEALEHLSRNPVPDLVMTDVMMPRLSGLELLAHIRATSELSHVPVILMSGVNPTQTRTDVGWNDFLKKPFNLDALLAAVGRQLRT